MKRRITESPRIFSSGSFSLPPSSKLPLLISLQSKAASRFSGDLKGPTPRSGARVGLFLGVCMCVVYTTLPLALRRLTKEGGKVLMCT